MEIDVKSEEKRVNIWLTRAESGDAKLRQSLEPLYEEFKSRKYLVSVFESGTESLEDSIRDLLLYNKVRLRELEKLKSNSL